MQSAWLSGCITGELLAWALQADTVIYLQPKAMPASSDQPSALFSFDVTRHDHDDHTKTAKLTDHSRHSYSAIHMVNTSFPLNLLHVHMTLCTLAKVACWS